MTDWYRKTTIETLSLLKASAENGLTQDEVQRRLAEYGPNELVERAGKSPWLILWEQFTAVMVVILIIAAVISFVLGDALDAIAIMLIVVLNAILGFSQEYRAEKTMAALKKMAAPSVRVRREGRVQVIPAGELVPGDIVLLDHSGAGGAEGQQRTSVNLHTQEAALTGESEPVDKQTGEFTAKNLSLGDRLNMVYKGTVVTYGRGKAVITETGMQTELGRIAEMLQTVEREQTPLQRRLDQLGRHLAVIALVIVAVVFALGMLRGEDMKLMFLTAISMAVAAVPEGLPAVVTIALALGAQRILKRHALIRKLPAVETLGSATVICSDKTGTLTENRMTVTVLDVMGERLNIETLLHRGVPVLDAIFKPDEKPQLRSQGLLLKAVALCNDAILEETDDEGDGFQVIGDPTEGALVVAAAQLGIEKSRLDTRWPRVAEIPFTSERKRMTTIHQMQVSPEQTDAPWRNAPFVAFCKGAVDGLLDISDQVWAGGGPTPMTDDLHQRILSANNRLAQEGQRVLGVAFRSLDAVHEKIDEAQLEQNMVFIGLVGMIDPPRPEVREAVQKAKQAGIHPIMITGDHPLTAQFIAQELNIATSGRVITGKELAQTSEKELEALVEDVSVYARVSPEHKLQIVNALQSNGHIVAMTGDGVNDAPALKKADIGVAMGITGTDVSKEAADMVLLDDNFATIVAAIEEGRAIYDNIRKFIKYTLTSNAGEIWVMLAAPFLGMPLPLLPLQILWINLVTDGLPGLALAVEPTERDTMQRPTHHPQESIFARGLGWQVLWIGVLMGFVSLAIGFWGWSTNNSAWQTMVFTTLTLSQMGNVLAIRSQRESLFTIGLFSNRPMVAAVALTVVLQLAVVYVPLLQEMFKTEALSPAELTISLALSSVVFWAVELEKWWQRHRSTR